MKNNPNVRAISVQYFNSSSNAAKKEEIYLRKKDLRLSLLCANQLSMTSVGRARNQVMRYERKKSFGINSYLCIAARFTELSK